MNISERGYIAQDIIRDIRRGTTNIEMELMPEDNNFSTLHRTRIK
jgi:hypothetical protein